MQRPTIVVDRGRDPSGLIVAFSGRAPDASAPLFMADLTRRIGWSRILLYDPYDRWYHNGIGHDTRTFADVVRLIDAHRRALNPSTVTIAGHSSGGYAALVAGQLLQPTWCTRSRRSRGCRCPG
jgi:pimeloyl-ACP methyl ester carboxylesterase